VSCPGQRDGTFQAARQLRHGQFPISVRLGIHGDGKLDLVWPTQNSSDVTCPGQRGRHLQASVRYPAGSGPGSVTSGDFNGDGKLDLATVHPGSNSVSVLLGNGTAPSRQPSTTGLATTRLGDERGTQRDGKPDWPCQHRLRQVSVLLGTAMAPFRQPSAISPVPAELVAIGDSMATGSRTGRANAAPSVVATVTVLLSNGDGPSRHPPPTAPVPSRARCGRDFNGDGKLDLVTAPQAATT